MELASTDEVVGTLRDLYAINRQDLDFQAVAGKQIISALIREVGLRGGATGYLYKVLQATANEARRRALLINPNPYATGSAQLYSAVVGNTGRMLPSAGGWEMTKGILSRHILDARQSLVRTLADRT